MARRKKVTVEEILEAIEKMDTYELLHQVMDYYNHSRIGWEPKICDHEDWEKRWPTLEEDMCSCSRILNPHAGDNYNPNPPKVEDYKHHIDETVGRAKIIMEEVLIAWHRHKKTLIEPNPSPVQSPA